MSASIKFKNLSTLVTKFKTAPYFLQVEAQKALEETLRNIKEKARNKLVPGYGYRTGVLRRSISYNLNKRTLSSSVYARAKYAAYVEFGTGTGVRVPKELREYASQFRGAGIRKRNYPAKPFLYPAVKAETRNLKIRLRTLVKAIKKHLSNK